MAKILLCARQSGRKASPIVIAGLVLIYTETADTSVRMRGMMKKFDPLGSKKRTEWWRPGAETYQHFTVTHSDSYMFVKQKHYPQIYPYSNLCGGSVPRGAEKQRHEIINPFSRGVK